jgi:hypothetical protein
VSTLQCSGRLHTIYYWGYLSFFHVLCFIGCLQFKDIFFCFILKFHSLQNLKKPLKHQTMQTSAQCVIALRKHYKTLKTSKKQFLLNYLNVIKYGKICQIVKVKNDVTQIWDFFYCLPSVTQKLFFSILWSKIWQPPPKRCMTSFTGTGL